MDSLFACISPFNSLIFKNNVSDYERIFFVGNLVNTEKILKIILLPLKILVPPLTEVRSFMITNTYYLLW